MPNKFFTVTKIVSGGQTGVDRAAWDFAIANSIPIGGYVPKGRLAEDGVIAPKYQPSIETDSEDPADRTKLNVKTSDATLIFARGELFGGTKLTLEAAEDSSKPSLVVDLSSSRSIREILNWLQESSPRVLNIAGPRESDCPGIYTEVLDLLNNIYKKRTSPS